MCPSRKAHQAIIICVTETRANPPAGFRFGSALSPC